MPKITDIGTPGAANAAIGGVPTLYYFDFASKVRTCAACTYIIVMLTTPLYRAEAKCSASSSRTPE